MVNQVARKPARLISRIQIVTGSIILKMTLSTFRQADFWSLLCIFVTILTGFGIFFSQMPFFYLYFPVIQRYMLEDNNLLQ
jgi:hypothetical protein